MQCVLSVTFVLNPCMCQIQHHLCQSGTCFPIHLFRRSDYECCFVKYILCIVLSGSIRKLGYFFMSQDKFVYSYHINLVFH